MNGFLPGVLSNAAADVGMSYRKIASKLGVSPPVVSNWFRGKAALPVRHVVALSVILRLPDLGATHRADYVARKVSKMSDVELMYEIRRRSSAVQDSPTLNEETP